MSRWTRMTLNLSPLADTFGEGKTLRGIQSDRTVQVVNAVQPGFSLQVQGTTDGTVWADIGGAYVAPTGGLLAIADTIRSIRVKTNVWSDAVAVSDQLVIQKNAAAAQTVTSVAPPTNLPAVYVAGFDDRAV